MMEDLKVAEKPSNIGYYSGLIDSTFAICELATTFQWGRLSDRIGRKPVLLIGLTGLTVSTTLFGFSASFLWAVATRCIAGALSANVAVVMSVISEITDESNQVRAFSLSGLVYNIGAVIGPIIGGTLANPAINFPGTLGSISLFKSYPYLLPCLVCSSFAIVTFIWGSSQLQESHPNIRRAVQNDGLVHPQRVQRQVVPMRVILASRSMRAVLTTYFLSCVLGLSFDVVFALFSYTPIHLGGLSRAPKEIGYALAISGVSGAIIQLFVFPPMQRRYGCIGLYRRVMFIWPVAYAMFPLINFIARHSMPDLGDDFLQQSLGATIPAGFIVWTCIACLLIAVRVAWMSYSVNAILVREACPSKDALGSTFGLASSVCCIARSLAPAFVSSLFAFSKRNQILGGNLVWVIMCGIALVGLWSAHLLCENTDHEDASAE
ncbi:MFS general substrate transporter [Rickenella mellea]|uniref:MFS general substrate transporter n=1 Tax=Rickenella mellea TaxID=50990 RepID=A0A4Y7QAC4_9AGAM|nr:MFS general substrate transporter [Rickenella mellea]